MTARYRSQDYEASRLCYFGITESLFGLGLAGILGGGAGALGLGEAAAGTAGLIGADAIGGAAVGTGLSAVEGKPLGPGALSGAITGGAAGVAGSFGPELASATGIPAAGVEAGIGAAGGLLGAEASGGSPLTGALAGGVGGVAAGLSAPTPAAAPTGSVAPPGGGASAAGIAGDSGLTGDSTAFLGTITDAGGGGVVPPGGAPGTVGSDPILGGNAFLDQSGNSSYLSTGPATTSGGGGGTGISDFVSKHWPMLASAGILGYEALNKNQNLPQENQLQAHATNTAGQAAALEAPLQTGILPPGAKQAVDASTAAQKGQIATTYANLGLTGSTMEAQAKGAVDRNAAAQTFQIADKLVSQGIDLSKMSAQDLQFLIDEQLKQDSAFTGALSTFAGGMAGARLAG